MIIFLMWLPSELEISLRKWSKNDIADIRKNNPGIKICDECGEEYGDRERIINPLKLAYGYRYKCWMCNTHI